MSTSLALICGVVALIGAIGAMGVISPRLFAAVCRASSRWVDTQRLLAPLDKPIDIDHRVLRYSRAFGALVAASASLLVWFILRHKGP